MHMYKALLLQHSAFADIEAGTAGFAYMPNTQTLRRRAGSSRPESVEDAVAGDSGKKVSRSPSDSEPTWSPSCWQPVGESKTRSRAGWGTHVTPGTGGGGRGVGEVPSSLSSSAHSFTWMPVLSLKPSSSRLHNLSEGNVAGGEEFLAVWLATDVTPPSCVAE